ncbi:putative inhibitor of apoptosis isoform X5 [Ostrea edulis]|uniref:putative inhibitor of apoptosis isoform X5 n=1 Tax=Ostrea edulis TaxID=37623 RepID=UPI0024AE8D0B|nr:putative inhibitor of apoptosis isoform X5 [Ostrea edulis]
MPDSPEGVCEEGIVSNSSYVGLMHWYIFLLAELNNVPIQRHSVQNMIPATDPLLSTERNTHNSGILQLTVTHENITTDGRQTLNSMQSNSSNIKNVQDLPKRITQQTSVDDSSILRTNSSSQNSQTSRIVPTEDETPRQTLVQTPESAASSLSTSRETQLDALMRDPTGINFERPKYSSYAILAARIRSFTDWPVTMTQTPRDMSLAGFSYAGYEDYTRCFFCGGELRNWEADDDPWVEHGRWFSNCTFVRQNRGQQFIDLVLQKMAEIEQETESLESGMHKVSTHAILDIVFELVDEERTDPSNESNSNKGSKGETTMEFHFNDTNISEELKDRSPPQQSIDIEDEGISQCDNSLIENDMDPVHRENTSLKDQTLCKICMEKNVSIAFLPCGHLACCVDCDPAMRKCPICREFVRGTLKTFHL